jgi:hypothetical protein
MLSRIPLSIDANQPMPPRIRALLDDAASRVDRFIEQHRDNPIAGFVPSDYAQVYRALDVLKTGALLPGNAFCEWGSGLGVITCLAAMLGFDAVGIEIDARLIEGSRNLANDHRIGNVELVQGSYVPDDYTPHGDDDESHVMTVESGRAAYEELGLDPEDFDCIFAYPWPGEDDVVTGIFDEHAARGAVLLTFHGQDGVMARRKTR